MADINPAVKTFLSDIGRKGGRVMSEKKRRALIRNARRPRPNRKKSGEKSTDPTTPEKDPEKDLTEQS
jgi:hypothetical protein